VSPDDLDARFGHHPPPDQFRVNEHHDVRQGCKVLAYNLNAMLPEGREKSLAITHLEEVMFWGNAAIARQS
jgi:hypothetical protein